MSELEKESLEAHVDLCSERYNGLHRELKNLGNRMDKFEKTLSELKDMMISMKQDRNRQLINWGVGIIGVLASAVGALLFVLLTK
jgi:predicted  nucleic acid-binding Zn-ribbon protein